MPILRSFFAWFTAYIACRFQPITHHLPSVRRTHTAHTAYTQFVNAKQQVDDKSINQSIIIQSKHKHKKENNKIFLFWTINHSIYSIKDWLGMVWLCSAGCYWSIAVSLHTTAIGVHRWRARLDGGYSGQFGDRLRSYCCCCCALTAQQMPQPLSVEGKNQYRKR